jgi:heme a synthase
MNSSFPQSTPAGLRRFAKLTFLSTLFLIFAGAMVTSTGSGLAVPDWPLSYGRVNPPMVHGIFFEHGHRVIATLVGVLIIVLAVWLHRSEPKPFLRKLGWTALAVVILQGVFGGLTVLLKLPPAVSILHAAFAEIFLCITAAIAYYTTTSYARERNERIHDSYSLLPKLLVLLVYIQILLGATTRHLGAGMAIPDFPLSFGRIVPNFTSNEVLVAFSHRAGALVVFAVALVAAVEAFSRRVQSGRRIFTFILGVLTLQITFGAYTIWTGRQPIITSVHVVTGALLLALTVLYALATAAARSEQRETMHERLDEGELTA